MTDYVINKLLLHYFSITATLPQSLDKRAAFFKLAEIYGIENSEALYELCESYEVSSIYTLNDYHIYERLKQIPDVERYVNCSEELAKIIAAKGQALQMTDTLKLNALRNFVDTEMILHIAESANAGTIPAMLIYGIALTEGYCMPADPEGGLRYLKRAARWNSPEALISCMYYDRENARRYANILVSASPCPYGEDVRAIATRAGIAPERDEVAVLLEKAFSRGVVDRQQYCHSVSRILASRCLSLRDKQYIIMSHDVAHIGGFANLPLNLTAMPKRSYRLDMPLDRKEEREAIERVFDVGHLAALRQYRPLMLVVKEDYIVDIYTDVISGAYDGINVAKIDVPKLEASVSENVMRLEVLNGIKEKCPNVLIFRCMGNLSYAGEQLVKSFLDPDDRKDFRISGVTLDLSSIVPIVIADKQNADKFRSECRSLDIAPISEKEKQKIVYDTVRAYAEKFGIDIVCDSALMERVPSADIDSLMNAVDMACMTLTDNDNVLTYDKLVSYTRTTGRPILGF